MAASTAKNIRARARTGLGHGVHQRRLPRLVRELVEEEREVGDHGLLVRLGRVRHVLNVQQLRDAQLLPMFCVENDWV